MRRKFYGSMGWNGFFPPLKPDGTSFNIQNAIPHQSQKTKAAPETSRAKEFQRGTAGAKESAKEGARVPPEGSDTLLGPSGRRFEPCHSDQKSRFRPQNCRKNKRLCGSFFELCDPILSLNLGEKAMWLKLNLDGVILSLQIRNYVEVSDGDWDSTWCKTDFFVQSLG